jgi:hypothetical protein
MTQNEYYVYLYLREDGTPYYVGKGKNRRAYQKHRRVSIPKNNDRIIFAHTNLSEDDAFKKEIELILQYGRKDIGTGILINLTDGGDGVSGYKWTHEARIKLSETFKKSMTPERRAAISKLTKKQYSSLESRFKHSKIMKETHNTPEFKEKQSEIMKEIVNRPEVKDKQKKTKSTPEYKEKQSKIMKEAQNRPEVKVKRSNSLKLNWINSTPEFKAEFAKKMKEMGNRPEVKDKQKKTTSAPEYKEKHSKIMKETHNTPEYKEKQSKIMKEMRNRPEVEAKRRKAFNETIAKRKAEKLQVSANLTEFFILDPVSA